MKEQLIEKVEMLSENQMLYLYTFITKMFGLEKGDCDE